MFTDYDKDNKMSNFFLSRENIPLWMGLWLIIRISNQFSDNRDVCVYVCIVCGVHCAVGVDKIDIVVQCVLYPYHTIPLFLYTCPKETMACCHFILIARTIYFVFICNINGIYYIVIIRIIVDFVICLDDFKILYRVFCRLLSKIMRINGR